MRRWGYGLAGLLALALFVGVGNQAEEPIAEPTNSQSAGSTQPQSTVEVSPADSPSESQETLPETTTSENPDLPSEPQEDGLEATEEPSSQPSPSTTRTQTPAATDQPELGVYEQLLAQLTIADEVTSGYDRDLFRHWIDVDGDGCNARREVLIIEAIEKPTIGSGCELIGGLWYSAYDGVTTTEDGDFDIDHMVPLKEAWDSGAHAWDSDRRRAFANDLDLPEALIAVTASSNRSKSDRDPADWLPPLSSYRCQYVRDWMIVKIKWELSVDPGEFAALRSVATRC